MVLVSAATAITTLAIVALVLWHCKGTAERALAASDAHAGLDFASLTTAQGTLAFRQLSYAEDIKVPNSYYGLTFTDKEIQLWTDGQPQPILSIPASAVAGVYRERTRVMTVQTQGLRVDIRDGARIVQILLSPTRRTWVSFRELTETELESLVTELRLLWMLPSAVAMGTALGTSPLAWPVTGFYADRGPGVFDETSAIDDVRITAAFDAELHPASLEIGRSGENRFVDLAGEPDELGFRIQARTALGLRGPHRSADTSDWPTARLWDAVIESFRAEK